MYQTNKPAYAQNSVIGIAGGGLAGYAMAVALCKVGFQVTLFAPDHLHFSDSPLSPEQNNRPLALSKTSIDIFTSLLDISYTDFSRILQATPMTEIHVSEKGHINRLLLRAKKYDMDFFGAVVSSSALQHLLQKTAAQLSNITIITDSVCNATPTNRNGGTAYSITTSNNSYQTDGLIIADGAQSQLRHNLGFEVYTQPYKDHAITGIITTTQPTTGRAYERFTKAGPLALLPCGSHQYAFVLTIDSATLAQKLDTNPNELIAVLQDRIGDRFGEISTAESHAIFPLSFQYAKELVGSNSLLLGNAALNMHPIAGQGYNLVVKDIAWLSEYCLESDSFELALQTYQIHRTEDHKLTRAFTHTLINIFAVDWLWATRGIGFGLANWSPTLQKAFVSLGGGRQLKQPKLSFKT
jgi:2-octaprenyl-6-methoxyphenol hydroxylase